MRDVILTMCAPITIGACAIGYLFMPDLALTWWAWGMWCSIVEIVYFWRHKLCREPFDPVFILIFGLTLTLGLFSCIIMAVIPFFGEYDA